MYRVFYNPDCQMYGVQRLYKDREVAGRAEHWAQVLPPKGKGARHGQSAYTSYKAVAERWAKQFNEGAK